MAVGQEIYQIIAANIATVIQGQDLAVRRLLAAFFSGGHVLLEDFPGTGKTTLAKALALSVAANFKRIQFTPDLLPSDIVGISIFEQQEQKFRFHEGPIFGNIILADEINRASPRTQSALLEAMAEGQVSVDGQLRSLQDLFFVIATQNPVESRGTYPLPEAQMDRFALQFSLGYVSPEEEVNILAAQLAGHLIKSVQSCVSVEEVLAARAKMQQVRISPEIQRYIVDIVGATRSSPEVLLGASPRASLAVMKLAQALAVFDGIEFVTPDHIHEVAIAAIAHRLVMNPQARFSGMTAAGVVDKILKTLPVPA